MWTLLGIVPDVHVDTVTNGPAMISSWEGMSRDPYWEARVTVDSDGLAVTCVAYLNAARDNAPEVRR
jgi:hypothetical protein